MPIIGRKLSIGRFQLYSNLNANSSVIQIKLEKLLKLPLSIKWVYKNIKFVEWIGAAKKCLTTMMVVEYYTEKILWTTYFLWTIY